MSDLPISLYGDQPEAPGPKAPGLMDQILGVFTNPVELFQRLNKTPSWGWALGATMTGAVLLIIIWGLKVDVDELLRPILEKNPQLTASQIDTAIGMYKRFIVPLSVFQAIFITACSVFLVALIYWLVGKGTAESERPSYVQAISATVVPSLVRLPHLLLVIIICLARSFGGLTPEKIAPTSLGYFFNPEHVKLHALLYSLDLFYIANVILSFLAARYLLRLKTSGAVLCVVTNLLFGIGFQVLAAK
jgi:phage gp36-like protein